VSTGGSANFYLYDMTFTPFLLSQTSALLSNQTTTTNPVGPSITPAGQGIVIAILGGGAGDPTAVAAPFTFHAGNHAVSEVINSNTSTLNPSWTTPNGGWCGSIISFVNVLSTTTHLLACTGAGA
jgi:hypothetical protein